MEEKLTYQKAIQEIEAIVTELERSEQPDIDHLSEKVKRVTTLLEFCKTRLHETEASVEQILAQENEQ